MSAHDFRPASIPVVGKFICLSRGRFCGARGPRIDGNPRKTEDVDLEARESSARNRRRTLGTLRNALYTRHITSKRGQIWVVCVVHVTQDAVDDTSAPGCPPFRTSLLAFPPVETRAPRRASPPRGRALRQLVRARLSSRVGRLKSIQRTDTS